MEIEAKYRVAGPEELAVIAALRQLGAYDLEPHATPEDQHNSYYDTADGRFAAARHGLRVRRIGERSLVTLKGPSTVKAGLHQRDEWEFAHDDPEPQSWPAGLARDLALQIAGGEPLHTILTITTERQVIDVQLDGQAIAELCLDQGMIYAGTRTAAICEIEIELHEGGQQQDIEALTKALGRYVRIQPEGRSKLERGLALLQNGKETNEH
jgi:inorganic triphosphatase YgiF